MNKVTESESNPYQLLQQAARKMLNHSVKQTPQLALPLVKG